MRGCVAMALADKEQKLWTTEEVADLFRVDPKTVGRWAATGRLGCIWAPGGHRLYPEACVDEFLEVHFGGSVPAREPRKVPVADRRECSWGPIENCPGAESCPGWRHVGH